MKWEKRLKWIRVSKLVIPIALAISIVFAGFSVFANEAKNFVIEIQKSGSTSLSLTFNRDLTELTDRLEVPVTGKYRDATWDPEAGETIYYESGGFGKNLPDDIAMYDGVHTIYAYDEVISFYSFSFYVVNNSTTTAVDLDMTIEIEQLVTGNNRENYHIDDALRVMVMEGERLLSDRANVAIYKKAEINVDEEKALAERTSAYSDLYSVQNFVNNTCVMRSEGEYNIAPNTGNDRKHVRRFTIIMWLEGHDRECIDPIISETLKMSMSFRGIG